jgi:hypothetical protein
MLPDQKPDLLSLAFSLKNVRLLTRAVQNCERYRAATVRELADRRTATVRERSV